VINAVQLTVFNIVFLAEKDFYSLMVNVSKVVHLRMLMRYLHLHASLVRLNVLHALLYIQLTA